MSNINIDRTKETVSALGLDPPLTKVSDLPANVLDIASNIKELDLSFNDLFSLEGLAAFSNLEKLILDNNSLTSLATLPSLPKLKTFWANKNQVMNQEEMFAVLASKCPGVTYLSLLFNPCCPNMLMGHSEAEYRRYRVFAKYRLPSLVNLDSTPISAEEADTAKKKGQFFQTADAGNHANNSASAAAASNNNINFYPDKPNESNNNNVSSTGEQTQTLSAPPLRPGEKSAAELFDELEREIVTQRGDGVIFGIQRHIYTGKSSEGNRFIGNDMLN